MSQPKAMIGFLSTVPGNDPEFPAALLNFRTPADVVRYAKDRGFLFTEEDLRTLAAEKDPENNAQEDLGVAAAAGLALGGTGVALGAGNLALGILRSTKVL